MKAAKAFNFKGGFFKFILITLGQFCCNLKISKSSKLNTSSNTTFIKFDTFKLGLLK